MQGSKESPSVVMSKWLSQEFLFVAKVAIIHRELKKKWHSSIHREMQKKGHSSIPRKIL
jgi:hypothetical protein